MTVNIVAKTTVDQSLHNQQPTWLLRLFYIMSAVFVVIVLAFNIFNPVKVLPRVALAPGFILTNQDGVRKTSEDFRGKLTVYNFMYTRCADDCSQVTPNMLSLRNALAQSDNQDTDLALVSISIDPEYDTPAILSAYAKPFLENKTGNNNVSWDFLTGETLRTKYVVGGGFNVYYQDDPSGQSLIVFEPRYVLVDGWGIVRAEYRNTDADVRALVQDIGYLVTEIRNSQGAARYAYEAVHLFACYH